MFRFKHSINKLSFVTIPSTKQTLPMIIPSSDLPLAKTTSTFARRRRLTRIRQFQTTSINKSNAQSIQDQQTMPSSSASEQQHYGTTRPAPTETWQLLEEVQTETVKRTLPKAFTTSKTVTPFEGSSESVPSQADEFSFPDYPTIKYPEHYTVLCTSDPQEMNRQIISLSEKETVFGLDMEWRPQFLKGQPEHKVALIQICNSDTIVLFQVSRLKYLPIELVHFLKNPNLFKSGVNIRGDGLKLHRDFNVVTNGLVELSRMVRHIDSPLLMKTKKRSLSALTSLFLEQNMLKAKRVRLSNWSAPNLTEKQREYAACDAYASYKLCTMFRDMLLDQQKSHITSFIIHLSKEPTEPKEEKEAPSISSSSSELKTEASDSSSVAANQIKKYGAYHSWPSSTTTIIRKAT